MSRDALLVEIDRLYKRAEQSLDYQWEYQYDSTMRAIYSAEEALQRKK